LVKQGVTMSKKIKRQLGSFIIIEVLCYEGID